MRCSSHSISVALNLTLFSVSVWLELAPMLQVQVHQCWAEGKGDLSPPAGNHLLQRQAVSCSVGYPPGTPGPLLPSCFAPGCLGLFLTRCRSLHFLLNFLSFLSAHFSSCQGPSRWQHDPWHVHCCFQFWEGTPQPSSRMLMMMLTSIAPSINPWCYHYHQLLAPK